MQHDLSGDDRAFLGERWFRLWQAELASSKEAALVGRWTSITMTIECEGESSTFTFVDGALCGDSVPESHSRVPVVLVGSARAWGEFLKPVPPPLHNDVLALDRRQDDFSIAGGRDELVQNLRFVQVVLSLARSAMSKVESDD